jgi:hypothetical protein
MTVPYRTGPYRAIDGGGEIESRKVPARGELLRFVAAR